MSYLDNSGDYFSVSLGLFKHMGKSTVTALYVGSGKGFVEVDVPATTEKGALSALFKKEFCCQLGLRNL